LGKNKPIGIFDSGIGGLTVVKSLMEKMPDESFIYFGDTAHVPYGNKSETQLFNYAHKIISFLISKQVKAIIVACGTHSSVTLPSVSQEYSLPMLGVVKAGARSAARLSCNGKIGVAATQATVNKKAYTREIQELEPEFQVFETACPRFVPLVEAGKLNNSESREAVAEYLGPLLAQGIDTLVLGCTHYPFLATAISEFAGEKLKLVDTSCETIDELQEMFGDRDLFNNSGKRPRHEFYVSGQDDSFFNVGRLLMGDIIKEIHKLDWD